MSLLRSYLSSTVVQSVQVQVGGVGGGVSVVAGAGVGVGVGRIVGVCVDLGRGEPLAGFWYLFLYQIKYLSTLSRGRRSRTLTSW